MDATQQQQDIAVFVHQQILGLDSFRELDGELRQEGQTSIQWQQFRADLEKISFMIDKTDKMICMNQAVNEDAITYNAFREEILKGTSRRLRSLVNEKHQVVWRFDRTFYAKMFGVRIATRIVSMFTSSSVRLQIFMLVFYIAEVLLMVGLFELIPGELTLAAGITSGLHAFHSTLAVCDAGLYMQTLSSLEAIVRVILIIFAAVCFAKLTQFDYRGIAFLVSYALGAFNVVSYDSMNELARKTLIAVHFFDILTSAVLLVVLNAGLMPDVDYESALWTIYVNDKPIPYSFLSGINSALGALIVLLGNRILVASQWPNRLGSAVVILEGIDHPDSTPLERGELTLPGRLMSSQPPLNQVSDAIQNQA